MKVLFYILFIVGMIGCEKTTENTRATVQNISESVYASGVIKSKNQYSVYATAEYNQTLLIVTHDESFAEKTNRIIKMEDGRIIQ